MYDGIVVIKGLFKIGCPESAVPMARGVEIQSAGRLMTIVPAQFDCLGLFHEVFIRDSCHIVNIHIMYHLVDCIEHMRLLSIEVVGIKRPRFQCSSPVRF